MIQSSNRKIILFFLCLLQCILNACQPKNINSKIIAVDSNLYFADQFFKNGDFASAIPIYDSLRKQSQVQKKWDEFLNYSTKLANTLRENGEYEKALFILNKTQQTTNLLVDKNSLLYASFLQEFCASNYFYSNVDTAIILIKKAIPIFQNFNDSNNIGKAYNHLGNCISLKGDYNNALNYFLLSKDIREKHNGNNSPELAISIFGVAGMYLELGDYDSAIYYYQKAIKIDEQTLGLMHPYLAADYNNLGIVYYYKSDLNNAISEYKKALNIRLKTLPPTHVDIGSTYINIGTVLSDQGNYSAALSYLEKGLAIYTKTPQTYGSEIANCYLNMSMIYAHFNELEKSISFNEKSINIRKKIFGNENPELAVNYSGLAMNYAKLGNIKMSFEYQKKSLDIRLKKLKENNAVIAKTYSEFASLFYQNKEFHLALQNQFESLKFNRKAFGNYQQNIANNYLSIATYYTELNSKEAAKKYIDSALQITYKIKETKKDNSLDKIILQILTLQLKNKFSHIQNENIGELKTCLRISNEISLLSNSIRKTLIRDDSKFEFSNYCKESFNIAIQCCYILNKKLRNESYTSTAFGYIEKSKSLALLEVLNNKNSMSFKLPDSLIKKEKQLLENIGAYQHLLNEQHDNNNPDTLKIKKWNEIVFDTKFKLEELILNFEKNYPDYYNLKYSNVSKTSEEIQKQLQEDELILDYYIDADDIFCLSISNKESKLYKIAVSPKKLDSIITIYRNSILTNKINPFISSASSLSNLLFLPFVEGKTNITIIPDGKISSISFETLISKKAEANYKKINYLINNYSISYHVAASFLLTNQNQKQKKYTSRYVGFAPTHQAEELEKIKLTKLNSSSDEVQEASEILNGKKFIGENISIEQFKNESKNNAIIHIASHFLIDKNNSLNSSLLFSNSGKIEKLRVADIYNMNLDAQLVMLLACSTGEGEIQQGEGVMNASRSFLYAGANELIMSIWPISDRATKEISILFLKNLNDGMPEKEALRKAKLAYLNSSDRIASAPFLWGSIIYLGNNNSKIQTNNNWSEIFGILIVSLIISLVIYSSFFYKRFNNSKA